uniref:Uncharacterized protein n=1 Tax=Romanomermis culicivorax TaxID=13658 RepID=A0A915JT17_ROMCU
MSCTQIHVATIGKITLGGRLESSTYKVDALSNCAPSHVDEIKSFLDVYLQENRRVNGAVG